MLKFLRISALALLSICFFSTANAFTSSSPAGQLTYYKKLAHNPNIGDYCSGNAIKKTTIDTKCTFLSCTAKTKEIAKKAPSNAKCATVTGIIFMFSPTAQVWKNKDGSWKPGSDSGNIKAHPQNP